MPLDRSKSDKKRDTTGGMLQTLGDRAFPMSPKIAALAARIQILEAELEAELAQRRAELSVGAFPGTCRRRWQDRLDGWNTWVTFVISPAEQMASATPRRMITK
jgi:hypothetical protein